MRNKSLRSGLFAAALAASLGFGASQVMASPGAASTARACSPLECTGYCVNQGADGGVCTEMNKCICF